MDPYENLANGLARRKSAYIRSIAARNVDDQPALARGYLKGVPGNRVNVNGEEKRPTASPEEVAAAQKAHEASAAFWADTPALRVGVAPPLDSEEINFVIARLRAANLTAADREPLEFPPWFAKDLPFPKASDRVHARGILRFTYWLSATVWVRKEIDEDGEESGDWNEFLIQDWIKRQLQKARKLLNDDRLIDRIRISFDQPTDEHSLTPSSGLVQKLTRLTVEGEEHRLSTDRAARLLENIARLLHSPSTRDNPGDALLYRDVEARLEQYVDSLSPNRFPFPWSDEIEWPAETWQAVELLAWLGSLEDLPFNDALVALAKRAPKAPNCTTDAAQLEQVGENPFLLSQLLYRPNVTLPDGWAWPDRSATGIYWWRALLKKHLVGHILSYKDTADFHITDVLRFGCLFRVFQSDRDERVPEYVATDLRLALQHFKYWFDGQPEYDREKQIKDDSPNEEMCFWSENHTIQFAAGQVLAGQLFQNAQFPRSARGKERLMGATLAERGRKLLHRWLDDRLRFGFSEWNATGYYNEDFPPLFNIVDFCDDETLRTKAAMVLDLLVYDLARFNSRGSFGTTAGRVYSESKVYGWNQSVGNAIEILFGTRGDFTATENTAVALATSRYDVPHALLAIGLDRVNDDRGAPLVERSRVSINRHEAARYGIGFDDDADVAYWWSTGSYFTDETLDATRKVVEKYPNLRTTSPFRILYPDPDLPWFAALVDVILKLVRTPIVGDAVEAGVGGGIAAVGRAGLLLPFPLNVAAWGISAAGTVMLVKGVLNFVGDLIKSGVRLVEKLFGDDDDEPVVPESTVIDFLEELLKTFNEGSTLSRANLYTYCNGDVLLGSVQNHLKGRVAFQKSAWQATIDCEASVWTGSPPSNTEGFLEGVGVHLRAWLQFYKDLFQLRPVTAVTDLALPLLPSDLFGDNGPNYWTGEFALPMVVQHENAAIIAYNIPNLQRTMHATVTHAWFPKAMFDETELRDKDNGTWVFGRKRDGFVALYSARQVRWKSDEPYKDKELYAEGGSNIWVCVVGNTARFKPRSSNGRQVDSEATRKVAFQTFRDEVFDAYLSVSGVGTWNQLHCSFDIPRASAPPGRSPRLELFYGDDQGRFAGEPMGLDEYPRFENKYGRVAWGARHYVIRHPRGLMLRHDLDQPLRMHSVQQPALEAAERWRRGGLMAARASTRQPLTSLKARIHRRAVRDGG